MQEKLVDLLGFADLDFIMELVAHKDEIVQAITDAVIFLILVNARLSV